MKVRNKITGKIFDATYGATSGGNMRMWVDGKFYTDKQFGSTFQVLRTATEEDFKVGTTLIDSEGYEHTIREKYDEGIWNTRGKVVFENEARFYQVAV